MCNRIPTFRGNLLFSSSRIQVAEEGSTVPDVSRQLSVVFKGNFFFGHLGCWIRGNYAVLKSRCPSTKWRNVIFHKYWILKQRYVSWTPLAEWTSEDTCDIFTESLEPSSYIIQISFTLLKIKENLGYDVTTRVVCLYVCISPFKIFDKFTDFYIWYKYYDIIGYSIFANLNLLRSVWNA